MKERKPRDIFQVIPMPENLLKKIVSDASFEKLLSLQKKCDIDLKNCDFNFSLYSPRLVYWNKEEKFDPKTKTIKLSLKADDNVIPNLKKLGNNIYDTDSIKQIIKNKNEKLDNYIDSLKESNIQVFSFLVETASPFITGLGSGHPTETAITLDRNSGVPYLPATSIKGVLRVARAINIAQKRNESYEGNKFEVSDKELKNYFGYQDKKEAYKGQFIILDSYPLDTISLDVDILSPHYAKYYNGKGKSGPFENESPVPKKFLIVPIGTKFKFRCAYIPLNKEDKCNEEDVKTMFKTAFETVGFGAKTAIGYGRFKEIE